jgi:hypothetical protein
MDEKQKQNFLKLPSINFSLRVRLNGLAYCVETNIYGIDHCLVVKTMPYLMLILSIKTIMVGSRKTLLI